MMTIAASLKEAGLRLSAMSSEPLLEAEILLAHALHKPRSYLHAWPEQRLSPRYATCFADYLARRCKKEPLAYITGIKEFWSLPLSVNKDTLIPRPETELLVESALQLIAPDEANGRIADLGTGSGAIALALAFERPLATIAATDISIHALAIARKNAQRLQLKNVSFYHCHWCTSLPRSHFNIIVSNPPYIAESEWEEYADGLAYEPRRALIAGKDGLNAIKQISQVAKDHLQLNGYLLIEHGFCQAEQVRQIFATMGYKQVSSQCDLLGHERITLGQLSA